MTFRASFLPAGFLLISAVTLAGQAPCTPPESMKAQLQGNPKAAAYTDLGVWFAGQKQYACAADAFATSLQMEPDQKDAAHVAFMFGVSLYFSGDTKEAVPALQEAEQLGYRDSKLHIILAGALDESHSNKDAEQEWRAALEFDPESSTALDALSNDLLLDKDFPAIIALLDVPRLLGQRTPQQSLNLATAYTATGKLDEAANVLRDGLNTSPDSLEIANRLAIILMQLNRGDEALALLRLTVKQHPENARAHEALGIVLAQLKEMAAAKEQFERAIALGDNSPEAKANLAKAVEALGSGK
jgi:Flp pilus assembly protein TadD